MSLVTLTAPSVSGERLREELDDYSQKEIEEHFKELDIELPNKPVEKGR